MQTVEADPTINLSRVDRDESDHELLIAIIKFKLRILKKELKPQRFDANKIPEEYGVEVNN